MQDGSVWSTGVGSDSRRIGFVKVIASGAVAAAAGNYFSIVLEKFGSVLITGKNIKGQLGFFDGSAIRRRAFSVVNLIPGAMAVAAGGYHSMVLTQGGRVWATGWNKYGQLGVASLVDSNKFARVSSAGANVAALAAGDTHSIILKQDGSVWAAGQNCNGQLGDGSKVDRNTFVKVISSHAVYVAAGGYHSLAVKQDGSVWATGWNEYGQLGAGSITDSITYVVVAGLAKSIAAGSRHSVLLKQDGSVWATGYNLYGQLGDGSTENRHLFTEVILDGVKVVAAGAFNSMVITQDNTVWATGSNKDGQFGDGSTISRKDFIKLGAFENGAGGDMITHNPLLCMCSSFICQPQCVR